MKQPITRLKIKQREKGNERTYPQEMAFVRGWDCADRNRWTSELDELPSPGSDIVVCTYTDGEPEYRVIMGYFPSNPCEFEYWQYLTPPKE